MFSIRKDQKGSVEIVVVLLIIVLLGSMVIFLSFREQTPEEELEKITPTVNPNSLSEIYREKLTCTLSFDQEDKTYSTTDTVSVGLAYEVPDEGYLMSDEPLKDVNLPTPKPKELYSLDSYTIDWGDGDILQSDDILDVTHIYTTAGQYMISGSITFLEKETNELIPVECGVDSQVIVK